MSEAGDKSRFKRSLEKLIKGFLETMRPTAPVPYLGATNLDPLEHITRADFIDNFLVALGWNPKRLAGEIVEEARIKGETTLFLDYLGVNPDTRAPQLIIEAKAWSKPMIATSEAAAANEGESTSYTRATLIAAAIEHCKKDGSVGTSPATAEWARWIAKLCAYVQGVHRESGHIVSRTALTAGRWLVIFTDPEDAFIKHGLVNKAAIKVFVLDEFVEQSDTIFDLLAYSSLIRNPPPYITPSRLQAWISADSIKAVYRALWIRRDESGAHFRIQPRLLLYAATVLERDDGVLVTVLDDRPENVVPHDMDELNDHFDTVQAASDQLLDEVREAIGDLPETSGVEQFPGFLVPPDRGSIGVVPLPSHTGKKLLKSWPARADEFLLVTGTATHFLLQQPTVVSCPGHDWVQCEKLGQPKGRGPVLSRSVQPLSFFKSGEDHHCAHRIVHDRREERCHILTFEEYLCCRACAFQTLCWPAVEMPQLPCGQTHLPERAKRVRRKASIAT